MTQEKKYDNQLIEKPWGSEYVIFNNNKVAIWSLDIEYLHITSLHCHPLKKTGLIVISGSAEISLGFYNREIFNAPSKTIIRPGLFHSTKAISKNGVKVLELETPVDKDDIVRYHDNYGREEESYKGSYRSMKLDSSKIVFKEPQIGKHFSYDFNGVKVSLEKHKTLDELITRSPDTIFAVLDGGIRCKNTKKLVLSPGEVIQTGTLIKLEKVFETDSFISVLSVNREY